MTPAYRDTRRRLAGSLGIGLAVAFALLAWLLLRWSGSQIIAAGWEPVAVADAVSWCLAGVTGTVTLALAWSCVLGAGHLLGSRTTPPPTRYSPTAPPRIGPRVAGVLLALTLGSPPALADATSDWGSVAVTASSTSDTDSDTDTGRKSGPSLPAHLGSSRSSANPGRPIVTSATVPDWRPVRGQLPVPSASAPASGLANRSVREPAEVRVVVRRGDSLWDIAAQELGPGASNAQISARWPHWYEANRSTIGPDPDIILPGRILSYPDSTPACPTNGEQP